MSLERASLLLQQRRHDLAETELRRHLAGDPDDAPGHTLLALCLAALERPREAIDEAREAIRLAPDLPNAHYAHALALEAAQRYDAAEDAIREAIRLDPEDADNRALLAQLHVDRQRWRDALAAADEGLAIDPEHGTCLNLRAHALVQLGRRDDAAETIDEALARDPEDPLTHANQGWARLHAADYAGALEHFREALRLNPQLEWAREGLVEALKARYPVYGLLLRYFLWMSRLPRGTQMLVIFGGWFGMRIARGLAAMDPMLQLILTPVIIAYAIFAVLTWTADPLFNLLLRLNPFGRYALSREQATASNWVGIFTAAALLCGVAAALLGSPSLGFGALCTFGLVLLVAGVFRCPHGWPRLVAALYTGLCALVVLAGVTTAITVSVTPGLSPDRADTPYGYLGFALLLTIAGTWLLTFLSQARPKR